MDKAFFLFLASLAISSVSSAQRIEEKIKEALNDSNRKKQSGKADIYIIDKNKISDLITCKNKTTPRITQQRKNKAIKKSYKL